ncbi:MAG TPA: DUF6429 family protein [Anaerovoracaceae bacterium]|nr:DUF6429 family protein [Anaerovoracaceae bacterium]
MENKIKELTLLLMYLTSWKDNEFGNPDNRTWKGYAFNILKELTDEGYIYGSIKSKSVYLSDEGNELAKELIEKYGINEKNDL